MTFRLLFFSCLLQLCILSAELGEVYPSYSNSEKDREVCRPSRQSGVHECYDRKKQSVNMADIFGVEKVWGAAYENNRQHGDFSSKKKRYMFSQCILQNILRPLMRNEKLDAEVVA